LMNFSLSTMLCLSDLDRCCLLASCIYWLSCLICCSSCCLRSVLRDTYFCICLGSSISYGNVALISTVVKSSFKIRATSAITYRS
jgi:hypothetical protein